ncbi:MAG: NAD(P)/FAD-dependent oxidoreductase, partial [Moraxellaceae bacterium]
MRQRRLIVIGNGMAGIRTVEELLALAPERYAITVISSEAVPAYNRIMLSPVLAGEKTFDDIVTHPASWYAKNGVTLLAGRTVTDIRRGAREVVLENGEVLAYDRLLLATGSVPFIVPVPGHQHPDVVSFRDMQDVERMVAATATKKRAAVIGGGLLGLEAANGLLKLGMEVTVIHDMPHLLNRQLDTEASTFLKETLEARGMQFRLGTLTAEIVHGADGRHLEALRFKDGSELATDMVVMAVGIRPNVALAKKAGLQVDKAILVNDTMQTFDPCIYAVGECVQHRGALFGL